MSINADSPPVPVPPGWEEEAFTPAGWGVGWTWMIWRPDRELNPQYVGIPDVEHYAVFYIHPRPDNGETCTGSATMDSEVSQKIDAGRPRWQLVSEDPLHLEPSLLCRTCMHHGFFRGGRWVPA